MKTKLMTVAVLTVFLNATPVIFSAEDATQDQANQKSSVLNTAATPVKGVVSAAAGVGEGAKDLVEDTVEETKSKPPIVGTIEGIHKGSEKVVDKTVKGAYKVATLGFGELDEVRKEQPVRDPDYENIDSRKSGKPTTFKFKF